MDPTEEQPIPVINIPETIVIGPGPDPVWDFSDSEPTKPCGKPLVVEIAETAIRLAREAGADPDDVETLELLLKGAR